MFEERDEVKQWFINLQPQTQEVIINALSDSDMETIREQVPEQHEGEFLNLIEEINQLQREDDLPRQTVIDEMTDEGFSMMVATALYDAVMGPGLERDLNYIRNKTTPEELRVLIEEAVDVFNSDRRDEPKFERESELMNRTLRVLTRGGYIQYIVTKYQGFSHISESLRTSGGFDDREVEAFIEPLRANKDALATTFYFSRIDSLVDSVTEINSILEDINSHVNRISQRLNDLESSYSERM